MSDSVDATDPYARRAEDLFDKMVVAVGSRACDAGYWLLKAMARAREETEDIWAEAESRRRADERPGISEQQ